MLKQSLSCAERLTLLVKTTLQNLQDLGKDALAAPAFGVKE